MFRQAAFEKNGKFLKGALHCHTTRSDGAGDPADVMRLHKENGYDFMAITDHRRYNYVSFAPETDLLVIPGMEMDRNVQKRHAMCFHTVSIGPSREDGNGFEQDQTFPSGNVEDQFEYQPVVDMLRDNRNMVIYCHPDWSCTPYTSFNKLQGVFAMEIWNSGCVIEDGMDTNAYCWDDILREGGKIWGVATDDGHAMHQHCKGWVMVNAKKELNAVLEALENGEFYSSTGPEIYDFYVEDGVVHVKCSPVTQMRIITGTRPERILKGEEMTEGEIKMNSPELAPYVRVEIMDKDGNRAWTNPIYFEDCRI